MKKILSIFVVLGFLGFACSTPKSTVQSQTTVTNVDTVYTVSQPEPPQVNLYFNIDPFPTYYYWTPYYTWNYGWFTYPYYGYYPYYPYYQYYYYDYWYWHYPYYWNDPWYRNNWGYHHDGYYGRRVSPYGGYRSSTPSPQPNVRQQPTYRTQPQPRYQPPAQKQEQYRNQPVKRTETYMSPTYRQGKQSNEYRQPAERYTPTKPYKEPINNQRYTQPQKSQPQMQNQRYSQPPMQNQRYSQPQRSQPSAPRQQSAPSRR